MRDRLILLSCVAFCWLACDGSALGQKPSPATLHPFKKRLHSQIYATWQSYVQAKMDMVAVGTVRIAVTASPDGRITNLRVLSNTSNERLAQISLAAIRAVKIPPIPLELLSHGKFTDEMSFTIQPN